MYKPKARYERTINGSFLILQSTEEESLDQRLILRQQLDGTIAIQQSYCDEISEFWYNISGMQSLETYCHLREIDFAMIERLMVAVCDIVDKMEWSLIATEKLLLAPEFIFVSNNTHTYSFLLFPDSEEECMGAIRGLMEYLLTRLNHKDTEETERAYRFYETLLREVDSIEDIRRAVTKSREEKALKGPAVNGTNLNEAKASRDGNDRNLAKPDISRSRYEKNQENPDLERFKPALRQESPKSPAPKSKPSLRDRFLKRKEQKSREGMAQKLKNYLYHKFDYDPEEEGFVAYPTDQPNEVVEVKTVAVKETYYPTICIGPGSSKPEGILLYEGAEGFCDIILGEGETKIGQDADSRSRIPKETISHIHACITREEDEYFLEDLNSTNGTYLNDQLLSYKERKKLHGNDCIRFADVKYRFV